MIWMTVRAWIEVIDPFSKSFTAEKCVSDEGRNRRMARMQQVRLQGSQFVSSRVLSCMSIFWSARDSKAARLMNAPIH